MTESSVSFSSSTTSSDKRIILVTGGSGLVGQNLRSLIASSSSSVLPSSSSSIPPGGMTEEGEEYIFLTSKDADLRNRDETFQLFAKYKPYAVIHLAAFVGGLFKNLRFPVEFYRYNTLMNDNILQACYEFKVHRLVSCLSTCIFPDKVTYPIDETMIHNGPPHYSNEGYAYAKRGLDTMSRAYRREYNCNFTTIVPTNIYGPYDNFSIEDGHVIPGLIHKCYLAKLQNTDFTVYGSGKPLRQFIYGTDLASLIVWVLHNYNDEQPIILSVDEHNEVSIANIAVMIAEAMNFTGKIVYDTSKADGQYKKTASNAKLRTYLPDYKFKAIKDGIHETCRWFIDHYDEARK